MWHLRVVAIARHASCLIHYGAPFTSVANVNRAWREVKTTVLIVIQVTLLFAAAGDQTESGTAGPRRCQSLIATPPHMLAGETDSAGLDGRQSGIRTTPGSSTRKPAKNLDTSA